MGSYIPFADDQPFALKVKTLADEELLEIWEETQQIEGIIRKELHTDMKLTPEYDYLIAPEAKAIPLVYEMARQSGADKYFVARKKAKAYMSSVFQVHVKSITTQGVQTLVLDQTDAELIHGKRIVIVDDVISTGESLRAMEELVNEAGGIIVGKMAVLAEGDANDRPDITVLGKLPLFNPDGTPKA